MDPSNAPNQPIQFLFREQCTNNLLSDILGKTASHNTPHNRLAINIVCAVVAITFLTLAVFGTYTRKITTKGILSTGQRTAHATATLNGVIEGILVRENESVLVGQPLIKISKESISDKGSTYTLTSEEIEEQIRLVNMKNNTTKAKHSQEALELIQKEKELSKQIIALQSEIALQRKLVRNRQESLHKYELLSSDGAASLISRDDAQNEYLETAITLHQSNQKLEQLKFDLESIPLKSKVMKHTQEIAISELTNELLTLRRELISNEGSKITYIASPISGSISAINGAVGQSVSPGAILASIHPSDSRLEAELYVPPEGIGFIEKTQQANIRISAFPFQKFGVIRGKVTNVSYTPYKSSEMPIQTTEITDPNKTYYKVNVAIEKQYITANGGKKALKPGLVVEADLLLEERKLYEWLFAPLYSFTKKHLQE